MHQTKVEFERTQKFINLKQKCKKNKKSTKKLCVCEREREREREREITFYFEEKLYIEWKKERQIYTKMM